MLMEKKTKMIFKYWQFIIEILNYISQTCKKKFHIMKVRDIQSLKYFNRLLITQNEILCEQSNNVKKV